MEVGKRVRLTDPLRLGEAWQAGFVNAAELAVDIGALQWNHLGPDGGFWTNWESCGGTNRGGETSRRDGPDATACETPRA